MSILFKETIVTYRKSNNNFTLLNFGCQKKNGQDSK